MKISKYLIMMVVFLLPGVLVYGSALTAEGIMQRVDDHRLISNNFTMTIRVESYLNDHSEGVTVLAGDIKNDKTAVLAFVEPAKMKGRKILIDNNDMQMIIPNVKNPIHITASQRLAGGISYSDIIGVSYAPNYAEKLIGEETVVGMTPDGDKNNANQCLVLELTALNTRTNYHKIIFWVDKQNLLPVKADFFALSGKKMTTVYYAQPKKINGESIITKMFLYDQINSARHFAVEYLDIKAGSGN